MSEDTTTLETEEFKRLLDAAFNTGALAGFTGGLGVAALLCVLTLIWMTACG